MTTFSWSELRRRPVYEDDQLLVLDKPPGISVMGERHADSLTDLAAAAGEPVHWVHRIDKVTSGLLLLARTPSAHASLTRQFADRGADKRYLAWVEGARLPDRGTIDLPLRPGRKGTIRIAGEREAIRYDADRRRFELPESAVDRSKPSYESRTEFATALVSGDRTLLALKPVTGRRHQIRVHLAWLGFPIVGDPLFHRGQAEQRTYLHSWGCEITCDWRDEPRTRFWAPPGEEFLDAFADGRKPRLDDALEALAG
ncbi:RluA family pseudouridine synthase [Micromonospora sp. NPDC049051]|uniref:RluA family pseudouridine synthase n=1 Tax=unclassified Micromonospora TaxID=2617518 RepID=UPI00371539C6